MQAHMLYAVAIFVFIYACMYSALCTVHRVCDGVFYFQSLSYNKIRRNLESWCDFRMDEKEKIALNYYSYLMWLIDAFVTFVYLAIFGYIWLYLAKHYQEYLVGLYNDNYDVYMPSYTTLCISRQWRLKYFSLLIFLMENSFKIKNKYIFLHTSI